LIHGHTHRPAIHQFFNIDNTSSQRIVLGDWYSQGSVLQVNSDGDFLSTI
jgi:UDP-2,3-diacylglucosamine hydrolase